MKKLWLDHPVWNDVEIYVNDESRYQYTYESDGKTYKATAIGDLDCDGTPGVWTISGVGGPSDVAVTLTPPPQGMY